MAAVKSDLYIEQGATFLFQFEWRADSLTEPGSPGEPIDLTGAVLRMQIRKTQQSEALVDASSTGAEPALTHNDTGGTITIKLPASSTNLLVSKTCMYDLEAVMPDGDVFRVIEGAVTVNPNITQLPDEPVVGE